MWKLLQLVVFLSVYFTGIYYEWTPNGLVLGIVAATCAFATTVLLGDFFRLVRWARKRIARAPVNQDPDEGLLSRRRKIP